MNKVEMKRVFLERFLSEHKVKNKNINMLFIKILKDENLLNKIIFVDCDVRRFPRAIEITEGKEEGLIFYHRDKSTTNIDFVINVLEWSDSGPIAMKFNLCDEKLETIYQQIIVKKEKKDRSDVQINDEKMEIYQKLDEFALINYENALRKQIDKALDERNEVLFHCLTEELLRFKSVNKK